MKRNRKIVVVFILAIVMIFGLSITALAASLTGNSVSQPIGSRTYTGYNTIVTGSNNATAGTTLSCNTSCAPGELGVYPTLQDIGGLVKSVGWIFNTGTTRSFYATTGVYHTTSGTYYSGGGVRGWNTNTNNYTDFVIYISPGLAVGGRSISISPSPYKVNENGQTYGIVNNTGEKNEYPDLIGAVGVDGTKGYVYAKELFGAMPSSPEEAVALMTDREYIQGKAINLYAANGVTVIGQFQIGGLIGVTVHEDTVSRTYNENGTITMSYIDGTKETIMWK